MTGTIDQSVAAPVDHKVAGEERDARPAFLVFGALLALAFPLVLFDLGSHRWFFRDEWFFLTDRNAGSLNDLFRPYVEHWSTLPVISYRVMWRLVGLRSYWPYEALSVLMHLTAAALLRIIMRRHGVGPWIATATAAIFVLFGPGEQNIVWAFQIGFVGSLVFGLTQLILCDHDGAIDRRDWLALLAGTAGLMCSGVAPTMVVIVLLTTLIRRGWRAAAFHTGPLAVMFGTWYLVVHPDLSTPFGRPSLHLLLAWVEHGASGTFIAIGHFAVVGIALAVLLAVGLAVRWTPLSFAELRRQSAAPVALLVGALMFLVVTAEGRWPFGTAFARSSRYMHLGAALVLPVLGIAADAMARRWRRTTPFVLAVLLVGIVPNIGDFGSSGFDARSFRTQKALILGAANVPFATHVPRSVLPDPDPYKGPGLTVGWLLDAKRAGKLPDPQPLPPGLQDELRVRLGLVQRHTGLPAGCRPVRGSHDLRPAKGDQIGLYGKMVVSFVRGRRTASAAVRFASTNGAALMVVLPGLGLRLTPIGKSLLCLPR